MELWSMSRPLTSFMPQNNPRDTVWQLHTADVVIRRESGLKVKPCTGLFWTKPGCLVSGDGVDKARQQLKTWPTANILGSASKAGCYPHHCPLLLEEHYIRLHDTVTPISEMRGLRSKQAKQLVHSLTEALVWFIFEARSSGFFVKKLFSIITQPCGLQLSVSNWAVAYELTGVTILPPKMMASIKKKKD